MSREKNEPMRSLIKEKVKFIRINKLETQSKG